MVVRLSLLMCEPNHPPRSVFTLLKKKDVGVCFSIKQGTGVVVHLPCFVLVTYVPLFRCKIPILPTVSLLGTRVNDLNVISKTLPTKVTYSEPFKPSPFDNGSLIFIEIRTAVFGLVTP